jgi:hypothetical protein
MPDSIRNTARTHLCRSKECSPDDDQMAAVSVYLGKMGKSDLAGYKHLLDLVGRMKESNVWKGAIKGYFFKGTIPTKMKSEIQSYARTAKWQSKTTKRMTKSGILWRTKGKKYLLIFAVYRGMGNKIYCSLTVI